MIGYNPEEKRIDNARKNLCRNFVQARKEILVPNLSDGEKKDTIATLLEKINYAINIFLLKYQL